MLRCFPSRSPRLRSRASSTGADADASTPRRRPNGSAARGRLRPMSSSTPDSTSACRRPTVRSSTTQNPSSPRPAAIFTGWRHWPAPQPMDHPNTPTCWPRTRRSASPPSRNRWRQHAVVGNASGGDSACAPCGGRRVHPSSSEITRCPCRSRTRDGGRQGGVDGCVGRGVDGGVGGEGGPDGGPEDGVVDEVTGGGSDGAATTVTVADADTPPSLSRTV